MKVVIRVVIQTVVLATLFLVYGPPQAALAQAPTMTVLVRPSDVPIPLTVVRGTLVVFQGSISQQMMMTTFVLRNDYGEFTKGDFLDTWNLLWNTAVEHGATEQIAVYWSRAGGPVTRLTRYNVKFLDGAPFLLQAENAGGKLSVVLTPTGVLTAQKFAISLDGAPTSITIDGAGKGTIDTSLFRPGTHTIGASASMTDGSVSAIAPVPFTVNVPPPVRRKPAPATAKRRPAHPIKTHHS